MSDAKRRVLATLGPRWQLDPGTAADPEALDAAFGRSAPRLLDVGVGTGTATRAWALAHPGHDVVAVELHRPGIARLLSDLEAHGPSTVRVVEADITALLADAVPGCFTAVRVLFPDPWPKRRHVDRRLVEPGFVHRVVDLLPPGGTVHLATDWDDYAEAMRAALATDDRLVPRVEDAGTDGDGGGGWRSARPPRPVTVYEQRGIDAGRTIVDLVAHVRTGP
jgi:tRNA (guanine-N7-)-methyltransferase